ncbi:MAG: hypothetical protein FJW39_19955 [Acidobacteria bacterium]|nr:hypothetical protein [Acidobacteriota bacterium]
MRKRTKITAVAPALGQAHRSIILGQVRSTSERSPACGCLRCQTGTAIVFGNGLMFNIDAGFERTAARQLASNVRRFPSRLAGLTTDRARNTDFSILKNTVIREGVTAQFRAEAYNVFNQRFFQGGVITDPVNRAFF